MEPTPGPWKWYWRQNEDGEADCGIFWERNPGQAYSVCRAPRYAKKEEWEANAALICRAVNNFEALIAALDELLPYAEKSIEHLNDQMIGGLYPAINNAKLQRARAALAAARA